MNQPARRRQNFLLSFNASFSVVDAVLDRPIRPGAFDQAVCQRVPFQLASSELLLSCYHRTNTTRQRRERILGSIAVGIGTEEEA
jgi:hypothetical protein